MFVVPERNAVVVENERLGITGHGQYTVLPYDMRTFQYLASKAINIEGPIRSNYNFPSRFETPFAHQIITSDFLSQRDRAFCLNEIGTCKTLSALWAADYLMKIGQVDKVLISSTLSTLMSVWGKEIFKSFPNRKYQILTGSRQARFKKLDQDADFYIINHDGIKTMIDWDRSTETYYIKDNVFRQRDDISLVIVDESSQFRKQGSDRYKGLFNTVKDKKTWLMSGGPMPNKPTDIWAQAQLIKCKAIPSKFTRFRDKVMHEFTDHVWLPKPGWENYIYSLLKNDCIRFKRDECLDLPPRITETREVPMTKEQKTAYDDMVKRLVVEVEDGTVTAANEGVKISKLLQIAAGIILNTEEGTAHRFAVKPKMDALKDVLDESGRKLVLFTPFVECRNMIFEELSKSCKIAAIKSGMSTYKKAEIFHDFQEGDLEVIISHPKSIAHGNDLTASHTVCWWGPPHNQDYEDYDQASLRITRAGQTHKQTVLHLTCSPIERIVYRKLKNKEIMQGSLMELLTSRV
jgi:SNF2 family DNA or RNA helicase